MKNTFLRKKFIVLGLLFSLVYVVLGFYYIPNFDIAILSLLKNKKCSLRYGRLYYPQNIAVDRDKNVYIADLGNHTIRKISPTGGLTTLKDEKGKEIKFVAPTGVAVDKTGNLFVVDQYLGTISEIKKNGEVFLIAGRPGRKGFKNGAGLKAQFSSPTNIALDAQGNIFVSDTGNFYIRRIDAKTYNVSTVQTSNLSMCKKGKSIRIASIPRGIAVGKNGDIFYADYNKHIIKKISAGGVTSILAGTCDQPGYRDNIIGERSQFNHPTALFLDSSDNLFVIDSYNKALRMIDSQGKTSTLIKAGNGSDSLGYAMGGGVDIDNNFYISDTEHSVIRKLSPQKSLSVLAGKLNRRGELDSCPSVN